MDIESILSSLRSAVSLLEKEKITPSNIEMAYFETKAQTLVRFVRAKAAP